MCILIEKASNCVSSETAYDWYDHFKKNCQNWPVIYQTKDTKDKAKPLKETVKSVRKEIPVTQTKKVHEFYSFIEIFFFPFFRSFCFVPTELQILDYLRCIRYYL